MVQHLLTAVRALRSTPLVSAVALLSLAFGIGANTAIFSLVNSLLLRSLPVREPGRLVMVTRGDGEGGSWTNPIWEQIRDRPELFAGALAWGGARFDLAQGGETDLVSGTFASGGFFRVLGVSALVGRTFTEADDARGGGPDGPVAVISYGFWQRRFGGAPDVVGQSLLLSRTSYTIVGVTPSEFFGTDVGRSFDVVVPLGTEPVMRGPESSLDQRSYWWLAIMARLGPGQSLASARASLDGAHAGIREATIPQNWNAEGQREYLNYGFGLAPAATGSSFLRSRYQRPLLTLLVVVALVLLVACANVANLQLARASARRHELSVRQALGASRGTLAAQLLLESLVLAGAGALLGLAFAQWGSRLLVRQLSTAANAVFLDLSLDWRVLGFTAAAAMGTAILFGTAPALLGTRVQPVDVMKEQGRGAGGGRMRIGSALVVAQVGLSLVLAVAAGLFVRTFNHLATMDLGFERDPILVANVGTQRTAVAPEDRPALAERLRTAVAALPGVARVATSVVTPISGSTWQYSVEVVGEAPPADNRSVYVNIVSPDWFATYGTPLLAGRDFDQRDARGAPRVAVVNQAFARKYLGGANPVGRIVRETNEFGTGPEPVPAEIVGLAADAVYRNLRDPVPPTLYWAVAQHERPGSAVNLSIRAAGGPPALLSRGVARALTDVDRDLTITFRELAEQVNAALIQERLVALLSGFFGTLALLLAGLGLYGVTAYSVNRRRGELGIRMALGAAPRGVVLLVLRRVSLLVGAGVALGTLATWLLAPLVGALLYGLQPRDTTTLFGAAALLVAVGGLAGWLPARRAAAIDPVETLRE
jgi:predicted permease